MAPRRQGETIGSCRGADFRAGQRGTAVASAAGVRATLTLLLLPSLAAAEAKPGSRFLLEVDGGAALSGGRGPIVAGLLGVGGKLPRLPFRFYLVAELAVSSTVDQDVTALGVAFRDDRTRRDVEVGLRTYLPVGGPVRLFGDLLVGGSCVSSTLDRHGGTPLSEDAWSASAAAAAGLQVRLRPELSVGVRVRIALTDEDEDRLRAILGSPSDPVVHLAAGVTWHF